MPGHGHGHGHGGHAAVVVKGGHGGMYVLFICGTIPLISTALQKLYMSLLTEIFLPL